MQFPRSRIAAWLGLLLPGTLFVGMDCDGPKFEAKGLRERGSAENAAAITGMAFSQDGKTVFLAVTRSAKPDPDGLEGDLVVMDSGTLKTRETFRQDQAVNCLGLSPDGKKLAVGCGWYNAGWPNPKGKPIGELQLWNVATLKRDAVHKQDRAVLSLCFSPDGTMLAIMIGGDYRTPAEIKVLDTVTWQEKGVLRDHRGGTLGVGEFVGCAMSFLADSRTLVVGEYAERSEQPGIKLWHVETGEVTKIPLPSGGIVYSLAVSPDGKTLAVSWGHRAVALWDLPSRKLITEGVGLGVGGGDALAFSPDGLMLAVGGIRREMKNRTYGGAVIWNIPGLTRRGDLKLNESSSNIESIAFSPDGKTLVTADPNRIRSWEVLQP